MNNRSTAIFCVQRVEDKYLSVQNGIEKKTRIKNRNTYDNDASGEPLHRTYATTRDNLSPKVFRGCFTNESSLLTR